MTDGRLAGIVFALCAFGWALVASAESRIVTPDPMMVTRIHTVLLEPEPVPVVATPHADALVNWDKMDRDNDCLWELLQREQVELTFKNVWAAGVWADALGGPCLMIGEDDE